MSLEGFFPILSFLPLLHLYSRSLLSQAMGLGTSVGSLLVDSWFATALSGALLLQTYIYFRCKPKNDDRKYTVLVSNDRLSFATLWITFM